MMTELKFHGFNFLSMSQCKYYPIKKSTFLILYQRKHYLRGEFHQILNNICSIRHPKEKISKSSIVPSKIIAPDNVTIEHFMDAPLLRAPEEDYDSVVILFPSADAVDLAKMP